MNEQPKQLKINLKKFRLDQESNPGFAMSGHNALSNQANWRAWHCDFVIYPVVDITWFETLLFDAEVNIQELIITAGIPLFLLEIFTIMFFTVFFHWMLKMKYSWYQQSSLIHGWFVYWIFGREMRRLPKLEIRFRMHRFRFYLAGCGLKSPSSDSGLTL